MTRIDRSPWRLDPGVAYLNHGGFGAAPGPVLDVQAEWRARLEASPARFFADELPPALDAARATLAAFLGADPADLVFVANATAGVSTVLASLTPTLGPGDELLATDHEYNATFNAMAAAAERSGARVTLAELPWPSPTADGIVEAIVAAVTPRTRVAVVSHITSATALVLPVARIVAALAERGVPVLVDAAHAPGQVPLDLDAIGAAWTTGNAHKWLCAPKSAAYLHVRPEHQAGLRPLIVSHGRNAPLVAGRSRFLDEADWTGTHDPSAILSIPAALATIGAMNPAGWPGVIAANHAAALAARDRLLAVLGGAAPVVPDDLTGAMALLPLPDVLAPAVPPDAPDADPDRTRPTDPLGPALRAAGIEVPVFQWPMVPRLGAPARYLRVSWQRYVRDADIERLAAALAGRLPADAAPAAPPRRGTGGGGAA